MASNAKKFTMSRARRSLTQYRLRVTTAKSKSRLAAGNKGGRKERRSRPPPMPINVGTLADDAARLHAIEAMVDSNFLHLRRTVSLSRNGKGKARHFLFTACFDDGLVLGNIITDDQIDRIRIKAYRAVRAIGLHGIFALQVVGILDTRNGDYLVYVHVHGLAYTYDAEFQPQATARRMSARKAYSNMLGAPSIDLRSRRQAARAFRSKTTPFYKLAFSQLKRDQTKGSLAHLAFYLLHPPEYMLKLVPSKRNPQTGTLRSNGRDYPGWLALQIHQIENQIPIDKAVFSVGEGKRIRSVWKRRYISLERR